MMGIHIVSAYVLRSTRAKRSFMLDVRSAVTSESSTANKVFHELKISLLKTFGMSFRIVFKKKGMSATEMEMEFSINQNHPGSLSEKLRNCEN
jgi:hypothetical protein